MSSRRKPDAVPDYVAFTIQQRRQESKQVQYVTVNASHCCAKPADKAQGGNIRENAVYTDRAERSFRLRHARPGGAGQAGEEEAQRPDREELWVSEGLP